MSLRQRYQQGRALLTSAIGFAILVVGVSTGISSRGSDIVWFIAVFVVFQAFALGQFLRAKRELAQLEGEKAMRALRNRVAEKHAQTEGPVLGRACVSCAKRIVIESDGTHCEQCKGPVHRDCRAHHTATAHSRSEGAHR